MPSKLGLHSIFSNNVKHYAQQAVDGGTYFRAIKAVDSIDWLKEIKQVSPETTTFGRYTRFHDAVHLDGDLLEAARWAMDQILNDMDVHRSYVDYWEITNEMDPPSVDGYRRHAELHFHLMDIAEREGHKIALFTWNAGTPEYEELEAVVETGVFGRAKQGGHVLALHEGTFAPPIWTWYGEPLPGQPTYANRGALCCRYRWLYEDFLKPRDEVIPLLMSEFGIGHYKGTGLTAQGWAEQMKWYDERMREDYYVIGNCLFTLGPVGWWHTHDFEAAMPHIVQHVIDMKDTPEAEWPAKGEPREQYKRVYVLLPPGAGREWARAVVDATWDAHRYTVGSSADDAGIGDLDGRVVLAVNPSGWPSDLESFFETHYAGVTYRAVQADSPQALRARLSQMSEPESVPTSSFPNRGAPRTPYQRNYVLLPPGAGREWAAAVVDATWDDFRFTVGSSADDAGIGELDDRVVLAVNPSGWPSDLRAFYEHYYPGVKYSEVQAGTVAGLRSAILARV
jgi:hypothetical protein